MRVPLQLLETQSWFAKMITMKLAKDHCLASKSDDYEDVTIAAKKYIAPSKTLESHKRIEIYHQQYWWRLMDVLQKNYPFLLRLFGYKAFNEQIACNFLYEHPPSSWSLGQLGLELPVWLKKTYHEEDKELVLTAANMDAAALKAFFCKKAAPLKSQAPDPETTLIFLQESVHLFSLSADLFSFREDLLQKPAEYFDKHPFSDLDVRACYFVLYQGPNGQVKWKEIEREEYQLLAAFKVGSSLQAALDKIEEESVEKLEKHLSFWFCEWTSLNLLGY